MQISKSDYIYRSFSSLSGAEIRELRKAGILNGYGGYRQSWITRIILSFLMRKFSIANSDFHDYGYWLGVTPRLECDNKFFEAMVEDMGNIFDRDKSKIGLIWNLLLCLLAYYSIRLFGKKYYGKPI